MLSGPVIVTQAGPLFRVVDVGLAVIHDDTNMDPIYGQQTKIVGFSSSFLMHLI